MATNRNLQELGTPWAELYRGSGRPTGRLAAEPVRCQNGEVAPDWTWVGDMTEQEFWAWVSEEEAEQIAFGRGLVHFWSAED